MLTKPTPFDDYYRRANSLRHFILKLSDGTSTWYLSTKEMRFGVTNIYPLLKKGITISESFDPLKKTWQVSDVNVEISNMPCIFDGGVTKRFSDYLSGIMNSGNSAEIWLMCGPGVTNVNSSYCLQRFVGKIGGTPEYDNDSIKLILVPDNSLNIKRIPEVYIKDEYTSYNAWIVKGSTPSDEMIPIAYGKYTIVGGDDEEFDYTGKGLAVGVVYSRGTGSYIGHLFADHPCNALTALWMKDDRLIDPVSVSDISLDEDDSDNRAVSEASLIREAWVSPIDNDDSNFRTSGYGAPTNVENAIDRDDSTYAVVNDSTDAGVNDVVTGECAFHLPQLDMVNNFPYYPIVCSLKVQIKIQDLMAGGANDIHCLPCDMENDNLHVLLISTYAFASTTDWQTSVELIDSIGTDDLINGLYFRIKKDAHVNGNGVADDMPTARLYSLRAVIKYYHDDYEMGRIYGELEGKEYDSWITSRSSNYADGDCIIDPAGIIEDILREYLSFADADIDLASFIDAENTSVEARINFFTGNEMTIADAIKQVSEQSTFAFCMTAIGIARLVPMNDNTPTTNRTIPYEHILDGNIRFWKTDNIANKLVINSRWHQEVQKYRDLDTVENSASQSTYGTDENKTTTANWKNVCGTAATHVANHYIRSADGSASDDDGIWAAPHTCIGFSTVGFTNADVEIGDWIEIDDATADPHIKPFGVSWSGKQFLVYRIEVGEESTYIEAMELF